MDENDRDAEENKGHPPESVEGPDAAGEAPRSPEDRRRFLKGLITGAAVASLGAAGVVGGAGVANATECGRKLPFTAPPGQPSTLAFASDLATIGGVPPAQWAQVQDKMQTYLGPLVDTGNFLAAHYNIYIEGCITITGGA
jgi:hypothetical protein